MVAPERPGVRRVGSICTGAFVLARAGLLDGRRATTHWCRAEQLRRSYPRIDVEEDAIYVKDGPLHLGRGRRPGSTWRWPCSRRITASIWP